MEIYIVKDKRVMIIKFLRLKKGLQMAYLHFIEFKNSGNVGADFN